MDNEIPTRGTTRILVGLILMLGTIAELLFTKSDYNDLDYLILIITIIIVLIFLIFGIKASIKK